MAYSGIQYMMTYYCDYYYYRLTFTLHFKVFNFPLYLVHCSLIHKYPVEYTVGIINKEKWNKSLASFKFIILYFLKTIMIEQTKYK